MFKLAHRLERIDIGARIAAISFVVVAPVFGMFAWAIGASTSDMLEQRAAEQIIAGIRAVVDQTSDPAVLRGRLLALDAGTSSKHYVVNANEGKDYGRIVIDASREGQNLLSDQNAADADEVKHMLSSKQGMLRYDSAADVSPRIKLAAFTPIKDKNWVVVGETYADDITGEATSLRNIAASAVLAALAILASIQFALIRRSVSGPLTTATEAAGKLAAGDLTTRIDTSRHDDIGMLLQAINSIGQGLANVVWNIRNGTEALAAATSEIAAGNHDLAVRTEHQAAALDKTAASIEEMNSTVRVNADNARQAVQFARTASEVATQGGGAVAKVVATMDAINQSSRKIVDIISVIDGIAFQTNILALNAAVEAARAGEQGRGFAVVAAEVRNLAQRSSTAAQEIKALIDSSVHNVQNGSELVAQAGTTMDEVVSTIKRVYDMIGEITTASHEQSVGIDQVNQAMTQMDEGTQQNAALVKQAASAADSLKVQTAELNNIVGIFRIKTSKNGTKDEAIAMVRSAIAALDDKGRERTFADICNKLGPFCDRDLYVVVYDMSGRNLAHGANAANVGKDMIDSKDGAGKPFVRERIAIIQSKGSGWQDYMFLNPISKQMEAKSMYLDRYDDLIIGCGIYQS